ncbi:MAG: pentapeptide repeat-containing protein [Bacteroidota bacterium]
MANQDQLALLKNHGVAHWNAHLERNDSKVIFTDGKSFDHLPSTKIDLSGADLSNLDLRGIDLYQADLSQAKLSGSNLINANLRSANLHGADLSNVQAEGTDFYGSNLSYAVLSSSNFAGAIFFHSDLFHCKAGGAIFNRANLYKCDLSRGYFFQTQFVEATMDKCDLSDADLTRANLAQASLVKSTFDYAELQQTDLQHSNLSYSSFIETTIYDCRIDHSKVYGISVWGVNPERLSQQNLILSKDDKNSFYVDDLELAQFIYLLTERKKIRNLIASLTSKSVLILGRFTPERKEILEVIAEQLRRNNLLPIIFDFDKNTNRDFTETVKILAGLSVFVIVDITNPKSSPLELQATIPDYQIPFVPIIAAGEQPFSMFKDLHSKYNWVLTPIAYDRKEVIIEAFDQAILKRAWEKRKELASLKNKEMEVLSFDEFIK